MARLTQEQMNSITSKTHPQFHKLQDFAHELVKYARHFFNSEHATLIHKIEASLMVLRMYGLLNRKCASRKELRTFLLNKIVSVGIEYGEENLDQQFVHEFKLLLADNIGTLEKESFLQLKSMSND